MNTETNDNRGRRVTDKHGGILDAAHQAVQLKELDGDVRLLAAQMSGNIQNLNSTLQALQVESRMVVARLDTLAGLQAQHETNKDALSEIKQQFIDFSNRFERWIDDERSSRDEWQLRHEAENENDHRALNERVSKHREDVQTRLDNVGSKVTWASGLGAGLVLIGGALVTAGLWSVNYRFEEAGKNQTSLRTDINRRDEQAEEIDDRLREVEMYLARGGVNPTDPYTPRSKPDGKR